jgi:hypothetical protein
MAGVVRPYVLSALLAKSNILRLFSLFPAHERVY